MQSLALQESSRQLATAGHKLLLGRQPEVSVCLQAQFRRRRRAGFRWQWHQRPPSPAGGGHLLLAHPVHAMSPTWASLPGLTPARRGRWRAAARAAASSISHWPGAGAGPVQVGDEGTTPGSRSAGEEPPGLQSGTYSLQIASGWVMA